MTAMWPRQAPEPTALRSRNAMSSPSLACDARKDPPLRREPSRIVLPKVDASTSRSISAIASRSPAARNARTSAIRSKVIQRCRMIAVVSSASAAPIQPGAQGDNTFDPVGESKRSARKRPVRLPDRLQYRQHP